MIKVVCGIIWKDDKVFIARRRPEKSLGGYWEFPGGKLEKDEKPNTALIRELHEEVGMKVQVGTFLGKNIHNYGDIEIELSGYDCEFISATYTLIDHDEYQFVFPKELSNFKIAPADLFFLNLIKNNGHIFK